MDDFRMYEIFSSALPFKEAPSPPRRVSRNLFIFSHQQDAKISYHVNAGGVGSLLAHAIPNKAIKEIKNRRPCYHFRHELQNYPRRVESKGHFALDCLRARSGAAGWSKAEDVSANHTLIVGVVIYL